MLFLRESRKFLYAQVYPKVSKGIQRYPTGYRLEVFRRCITRTGSENDFECKWIRISNRTQTCWAKSTVKQFATANLFWELFFIWKIHQLMHYLSYKRLPRTLLGSLMHHRDARLQCTGCNSSCFGKKEKFSGCYPVTEDFLSKKVHFLKFFIDRDSFWFRNCCLDVR